MFKNIDKIINKIFTQKQKKDYNSFLYIAKQWEIKISQTIQKNATIIDYSNKKVTIKAKTPAWKNEISFLKEDIKKNFQTNRFLLKRL